MVMKLLFLDIVSTNKVQRLVQRSYSLQGLNCPDESA
ncbi:unnamed protein product [Penicillium roqueforti FM164]|uniref:Genomic scaffold, ProqFM164S01 n=1 Tax=Penicillium roqueforti (strain FM164) TaxID=1365484 RepID=W6PTQ0_PENRF|nr:unnamed protein product [Penicillium roqueforti FM164]